MRPIIVFIILLCSVAIRAQAQERSLVRKGNELYAAGKFKEAAAAYGKASQKSPTFTPGVFNLGNALIQQKQYEAARKAMENAAKTAKDPAMQSGAHYNTGNTWMSEAQWQKALDAYKAALRKNPADADARYNYSYALAKLRKQQEEQKKQQGGGGKDEKKEDKGDDGKQDDKKEDSEGAQDGGKKQQPQRPQPKPSALSEQQADNLLKALQQEERKVQDKMQQGKAQPVKMEKDW